MKKIRAFIAGRTQWDLFIAVVLLFCSIYTLFSFAPSSYSLILNTLGVQDQGLFLGRPREIRWDEMRVTTPTFQAVVNNQFRRYNETSIYKEDLRCASAYPIKDWGIVFKPYYWPFFLVDPAYAYSFHFSFFFAAFLIGFYLLFLNFGFDRVLSSTSSLLLFFSSYVQFWWSSFGGQVAIFPWVLLVFISPLKNWLKYSLLTYVLVAWMIYFFYPATLSAYCIVGALAVYSFRKDAVSSRNLIFSSIAFTLAAGITFIYLRDWILAINQSPLGHRVVSGGRVPWKIWISQLFPFFSYKGRTYDSIVPAINTCEASSVGSYLLLFCFCFSDLRGLLKKLSFDQLRKASGTLSFLLLGFFILSVWMLVPIPGKWVKLLFWQMAGPNRLFFASGFLLTLVGMYWFRIAEFKLNKKNFFVFSFFVLLVTLLSKVHYFHFHIKHLLMDCLILLLIGLVLIFQKRMTFFTPRTALLWSMVLVNFLVFGTFNPIQSTKPIFHREETQLTKSWKEKALKNPNGWLVESEIGSVLNGWGFRSVAHTLPSPQLDFFRKYFPDLSEKEFTNLFNRWGYIFPRDIEKPDFFSNDLIIQVPKNRFQ